MTNILVAIENIVKEPILDIIPKYRSANRANSMGDALEFYVKDIFCGSLHETDLRKKDVIYSTNFSYLGNQNNPPDIIIKGGDAIEVKKIENVRSGIALNSSYPKDKLYSDSPMITSDCKLCEDWREKDLIYVVGVSKENKLCALWFIYGDCYAAHKEIYERVKDKLSKGINEMPGVEFAATNELARVNKVDPLGITYLRIRGMWGIDNPVRVFDYVSPFDTAAQFSVNAIMLKEKYLSFPDADRKSLENLAGAGLSISDIKIKSPNNPAHLIEAKLLSFKK